MDGEKIALAIFALCSAAGFSDTDLEEKLTEISDGFVSSFEEKQKN